LNNKYTTLTEVQLGVEDRLFLKRKATDSDLKQKHLKLFRPNLENPANKGLTEELNN